MKPATYSAVEFDIQLSLDAIAAVVETESETIDYLLARYGDGIIDELLIEALRKYLKEIESEESFQEAVGDVLDDVLTEYDVVTTTLVKRGILTDSEAQSALGFIQVANERNENLSH